MASVEGNSLRSCASDTPEASPISAKPIRSIGFSASSVRNAAMIFSRSPAGAAGAERRGERAEDLRAERRAMTILLGGMQPACGIARPARDGQLQMYVTAGGVPRPQERPQERSRGFSRAQRSM